MVNIMITHFISKLSKPIPNTTRQNVEDKNDISNNGTNKCTKHFNTKANHVHNTTRKDKKKPPGNIPTRQWYTVVIKTLKKH